jgi:hypothetical protein
MVCDASWLISTISQNHCHCRWQGIDRWHPNGSRYVLRASVNPYNGLRPYLVDMQEIVIKINKMELKRSLSSILPC